MSHGQPGLMKSLALHTLGPAAIGRFDYVFRPSLRKKWGGPMNGQAGRQRICRQIIETIKPSAIVETGAFRGTTTEFLAGFGAPVYTVEVNAQYHAYAALRLRKLRDRVRLTLGDSRSFLRELALDSTIPKDAVFFYLDAHWDEDLPLADEIATILEFWSRAVIMVDDFEVPGDEYRYDDYGPGRALNAEYLATLGRRDLALFYPSLPAREETGARRGCVVLCNEETTRRRLEALDSLRPA